MKPTTNAGIAVLLLLSFSCTKETLTTPSVSTSQTSDNAVTGGHYIGEHFGGGIIFYVNKKGTHGLIADTADLGAARWWNGTFIATGAIGTAIGTGADNTKKIVAAQGKGKYAAYLCATYKGGGFTDWFLPSKDELNELYKQRSLLGNFLECCYWSSTESAEYGSWDQYFVTGEPEDSHKTHLSNVRPVRSF